jgi:hypothetical protein
MGTEKGTIYLYNLEKKQVEIEYSGMYIASTNKKNPVVDLAWNPGEDVFLALFKDGALRLYGQAE